MQRCSTAFQRDQQAPLQQEPGIVVKVSPNSTGSSAPTTFWDLAVFIIGFLTLGAPEAKRCEILRFGSSPPPPKSAASRLAKMAARINLAEKILKKKKIHGEVQTAKGRGERKVQHSKNNTELEIMRPLIIWGEFILEEKRVAKPSRM